MSTAPINLKGETTHVNFEDGDVVSLECHLKVAECTGGDDSDTVSS